MRRRRFKDQRLYDRGTRFIWAKLPDEHGRIVRVSTHCTDEKAASSFCDEWERKAADPGYGRAASTSLGQAVGDWLEHLRRLNMKPATYEINEQKVGHFIRLWGADWPLVRITNDLMLSYIDTRESEPGHTNGHVAPLTIKTEMDKLRRCLEWAKFRGHFPADLGSIFPPDYSGKHKPRERWPTPEEADRLLAQLAPERGAWVAYVLATSARKAEAFRAQPEDVEWPTQVTLRGSKTEGATRVVPITGLVDKYLVYAMQHAPIAKRGNPMFLSWGNYCRDIKAACVRAGIAEYTPNDLRRAYGQWHRRAGLSDKDVSLLLGHTTDTLAQTTYAKLTSADIAARLRKQLPVSNLYTATAQTVAIDPNAHTADTQETAKTTASPAGVEPATTALGIRLSDGGSSARRSSGTRLGVARRRGACVPILYCDVREFRRRASAWFRRAA